MSTWMTSKLSSAGRLTIPQRLLARLGVREGDEVLLQKVSEGVILLSAASFPVLRAPTICCAAWSRKLAPSPKHWESATNRTSIH